MIESRFWEVIEEPRGGCSRLGNKAPRKHDFDWWRCVELEGDLYIFFIHVNIYSNIKLF